MDNYSSMSDLLRNLPSRDNYEIFADRSRRSKLKLFAPHGGCIEPCTSQLTAAIAASLFDSYVFSGMRKKDCYRNLHVTSTHYDEPQCVEMAAEAEVALALHGCDGEETFAQIGGGNAELASDLLRRLNDLGYTAIRPSEHLRGIEEANFINRARQGGVQIELSVGFRRMLFPGFPRSLQRHPSEFPRFVEAMRSWALLVEGKLESESAGAPSSRQ